MKPEEVALLALDKAKRQAAEIDRLKAEIQALKAALVPYADKNNWHKDYGLEYCDIIYTGPSPDYDGSAIARRALRLDGDK